MLVELHIRRFSRRRKTAGSEIKFPGNVTYEFKPRPDLTDGNDDAHVCVVEDEAHLARLLSIKEYTQYGEGMVEPEPEPEPVLEEIPDEPSEDDKLKEDEDHDLDLAMCETIVGMTVDEAINELGPLPNSALAQLATMERAGKARATLLAAIQDEQGARQEEADQE